MTYSNITNPNQGEAIPGLKLFLRLPKRLKFKVLLNLNPKSPILLFLLAFSVSSISPPPSTCSPSTFSTWISKALFGAVSEEEEVHEEIESSSQLTCDPLLSNVILRLFSTSSFLHFSTSGLGCLESLSPKYERSSSNFSSILSVEVI